MGQNNSCVTCRQKEKSKSKQTASAKKDLQTCKVPIPKNEPKDSNITANTIIRTGCQTDEAALQASVKEYINSLLYVVCQVIYPVIVKHNETSVDSLGSVDSKAVGFGTEVETIEFTPQSTPSKTSRVTIVTEVSDGKGREGEGDDLSDVQLSEFLARSRDSLTLYSPHMAKHRLYAYMRRRLHDMARMDDAGDMPAEDMTELLTALKHADECLQEELDSQLTDSLARRVATESIVGLFQQVFVNSGKAALDDQYVPKSPHALSNYIVEHALMALATDSFQQRSRTHAVASKQMLSAQVKGQAEKQSDASVLLTNAAEPAESSQRQGQESEAEKELNASIPSTDAINKTVSSPGQGQEVEKESNASIAPINANEPINNSSNNNVTTSTNQNPSSPHQSTDYNSQSSNQSAQAPTAQSTANNQSEQRSQASMASSFREVSLHIPALDAMGESEASTPVTSMPRKLPFAESVVCRMLEQIRYSSIDITDLPQDDRMAVESATSAECRRLSVSVVDDTLLRPISSQSGDRASFVQELLDTVIRELQDWQIFTTEQLQAENYYVVFASKVADETVENTTANVLEGKVLLSVVAELGAAIFGYLSKFRNVADIAKAPPIPAAWNEPKSDSLKLVQVLIDAILKRLQAFLEMRIPYTDEMSLLQASGALYKVGLGSSDEGEGHEEIGSDNEGEEQIRSDEREIGSDEEGEEEQIRSDDDEQAEEQIKSDYEKEAEKNATKELELDQTETREERSELGFDGEETEFDENKDESFEEDFNAAIDHEEVESELGELNTEMLKDDSMNIRYIAQDIVKEAIHTAMDLYQTAVELVEDVLDTVFHRSDKRDSVEKEIRKDPLVDDTKPETHSNISDISEKSEVHSKMSDKSSTSSSSSSESNESKVHSKMSDESSARSTSDESKSKLSRSGSSEDDDTKSLATSFTEQVISRTISKLSDDAAVAEIIANYVDDIIRDATFLWELAELVVDGAIKNALALCRLTPLGDDSAIDEYEFETEIDFEEVVVSTDATDEFADNFAQRESSDVGDTSAIIISTDDQQEPKKLDENYFDEQEVDFIETEEEHVATSDEEMVMEHHLEEIIPTLAEIEEEEMEQVTEEEEEIEQEIDDGLLSRLAKQEVDDVIHSTTSAMIDKPIESDHFEESAKQHEQENDKAEVELMPDAYKQLAAIDVRSTMSRLIEKYVRDTLAGLSGKSAKDVNFIPMQSRSAPMSPELSEMADRVVSDELSQLLTQEGVAAVREMLGKEAGAHFVDTQTRSAAEEIAQRLLGNAVTGFQPPPEVAVVASASTAVSPVISPLLAGKDGELLVSPEATSHVADNYIKRVLREAIEQIYNARKQKDEHMETAYLSHLDHVTENVLRDELQKLVPVASSSFEWSRSPRSPEVRNELIENYIGKVLMRLGGPLQGIRFSSKDQAELDAHMHDTIRKTLRNFLENSGMTLVPTSKSSDKVQTAPHIEESIATIPPVTAPCTDDNIMHSILTLGENANISSGLTLIEARKSPMPSAVTSAPRSPTPSALVTSDMIGSSEINPTSPKPVTVHSVTINSPMFTSPDERFPFSPSPVGKSESQASVETQLPLIISAAGSPIPPISCSKTTGTTLAPTSRSFENIQTAPHIVESDVKQTREVAPISAADAAKEVGKTPLPQTSELIVGITTQSPATETKTLDADVSTKVGASVPDHLPQGSVTPASTLSPLSGDEDRMLESYVKQSIKDASGGTVSTDINMVTFVSFDTDRTAAKSRQLSSGLAAEELIDEVERAASDAAIVDEVTLAKNLTKAVIDEVVRQYCDSYTDGTLPASLNVDKKDTSDGRQYSVTPQHLETLQQVAQLASNDVIREDGNDVVQSPRTLSTPPGAGRQTPLIADIAGQVVQSCMKSALEKMVNTWHQSAASSPAPSSPSPAAAAGGEMQGVNDPNSLSAELLQKFASLANMSVSQLLTDLKQMPLRDNDIRDWVKQIVSEAVEKFRTVPHTSSKQSPSATGSENMRARSPRSKSPGVRLPILCSTDVDIVSPVPPFADIESTANQSSDNKMTTNQNADNKSNDRCLLWSPDIEWPRVASSVQLVTDSYKHVSPVPEVFTPPPSSSCIMQAGTPNISAQTSIEVDVLMPGNAAQTLVQNNNSTDIGVNESASSEIGNSSTETAAKDEEMQLTNAATLCKENFDNKNESVVTKEVPVVNENAAKEGHSVLHNVASHDTAAVQMQLGLVPSDEAVVSDDVATKMRADSADIPHVLSPTTNADVWLTVASQTSPDGNCGNHMHHQSASPSPISINLSSIRHNFSSPAFEQLGTVALTTDISSQDTFPERLGSAHVPIILSPDNTRGWPVVNAGRSASPGFRSPLTGLTTSPLTVSTAAQTSIAALIAEELPHPPTAYNTSGSATNQSSNAPNMYSDETNAISDNKDHQPASALGLSVSASIVDDSRTASAVSGPKTPQRPVSAAPATSAKLLSVTSPKRGRSAAATDVAGSQATTNCSSNVAMETESRINSAMDTYIDAVDLTSSAHLPVSKAAKSRAEAGIRERQQSREQDSSLATFDNRVIVTSADVEDEKREEDVVSGSPPTDLDPTLSTADENTNPKSPTPVEVPLSTEADTTPVASSSPVPELADLLNPVASLTMTVVDVAQTQLLPGDTGLIPAAADLLQYAVVSPDPEQIRNSGEIPEEVYVKAVRATSAASVPSSRGTRRSVDNSPATKPLLTENTPGDKSTSSAAAKSQSTSSSVMSDQSETSTQADRISRTAIRLATSQLSDNRNSETRYNTVNDLPRPVTVEEVIANSAIRLAASQISGYREKSRNENSQTVSQTLTEAERISSNAMRMAASQLSDYRDSRNQSQALLRQSVTSRKDTDQQAVITPSQVVAEIDDLQLKYEGSAISNTKKNVTFTADAAEDDDDDDDEEVGGDTDSNFDNETKDVTHKDAATASAAAGTNGEQTVSKKSLKMRNKVAYARTHKRGKRRSSEPMPMHNVFRQTDDNNRDVSDALERRGSEPDAKLTPGEWQEQGLLIQPMYNNRPLDIDPDLVAETLSIISVKYDDDLDAPAHEATDRNSFWNLKKPDLAKIPRLQGECLEDVALKYSKLSQLSIDKRSIEAKSMHSELFDPQSDDKDSDKVAAAAAAASGHDAVPPIITVFEGQGQDVKDSVTEVVALLTGEAGVDMSTSSTDDNQHNNALLLPSLSAQSTSEHMHLHVAEFSVQLESELEFSSAAGADSNQNVGLHDSESSVLPKLASPKADVDFEQINSEVNKGKITPSGDEGGGYTSDFDEMADSAEIISVAISAVSKCNKTLSPNELLNPNAETAPTETKPLKKMRKGVNTLNELPRVGKVSNLKKVSEKGKEALGIKRKRVSSANSSGQRFLDADSSNFSQSVQELVSKNEKTASGKRIAGNNKVSRQNIPTTKVVFENNFIDRRESDAVIHRSKMEQVKLLHSNTKTTHSTSSLPKTIPTLSFDKMSNKSLRDVKSTSTYSLPSLTMTRQQDTTSSRLRTPAAQPKQKCDKISAKSEKSDKFGQEFGQTGAQSFTGSEPRLPTSPEQPKTGATRAALYGRHSKMSPTQVPTNTPLTTTDESSSCDYRVSPLNQIASYDLGDIQRVSLSPEMCADGEFLKKRYAVAMDTEKPASRDEEILHTHLPALTSTPAVAAIAAASQVMADEDTIEADTVPEEEGLVTMRSVARKQDQRSVYTSIVELRRPEPPRMAAQTDTHLGSGQHVTSSGTPRPSSAYRRLRASLALQQQQGQEAGGLAENVAIGSRSRPPLSSSQHRTKDGSTSAHSCHVPARLEGQGQSQDSCEGRPDMDFYD